MVFVAALLAFAPLALFGLSVGVQARTVIQNTATLFVWDDWNSFGTDLGTPIVNNYFNQYLPYWQLWNVTDSSSFDGPYFKFVNERQLSDETFVIEAHVDGLPGSGLKAEKFGTIFKYVNPDGATPVIYSFIFIEDQQLAVTAPTASGPGAGQLTLQPYDPSNAYQQFVFYDPPVASVKTGSTTNLGPPIPIPITDGYSRAAKL